MLIKAYGLFWRADEIDWYPGSGNKQAFQLLGRIGHQRDTLRVADFRKQRGLYVLYDEYGPAYVGLSRKQDIANRLRSHWGNDHLQGKWDRFSWFGFRGVSESRDERGLQKLKTMPLTSKIAPAAAIADMEALLIWSLGPRANKARMRFQDGEEWTQIAHDDCETYLQKVAP